MVIWAAGTSIDSLGHTIDYQAQVNVYDAMAYTCAGRVVVVGSIGTWKEGTDWPDWYDEAASELFYPMFRGFPYTISDVCGL